MRANKATAAIVMAAINMVHPLALASLLDRRRLGRPRLVLVPRGRVGL